MNCVRSAFVFQFYTVSNPHTTHLLTIHCCVCVYKVIWTFYYKGPWFRVGGSFTIFVSESWKKSRSSAHKEKSTSLSAWKHNTGAEQSIVAYCAPTVLSSRMRSKPKGPGALHSTSPITLLVASSHTPADIDVGAYTQTLTANGRTGIAVVWKLNVTKDC